MTLGVKVIGCTVDSSFGIYNVLAVLIIVVVAVEVFPALGGIAYSGELKPAVPVVPAVFADLLIAYAVVAASSVNFHAVLNVYAYVIGT